MTDIYIIYIYIERETHYRHVTEKSWINQGIKEFLTADPGGIVQHTLHLHSHTKRGGQMSPLGPEWLEYIWINILKKKKKTLHHSYFYYSYKN